MGAHARARLGGRDARGGCRVSSLRGERERDFARERGFGKVVLTGEGLEKTAGRSCWVRCRDGSGFYMLLRIVVCMRGSRYILVFKN